MLSFNSPWFKRTGVAAAALGIATVAHTGIAHATTLESPGSPAVTFESWNDGQSNLTVSWTPVAGADGYEVASTPGDIAPTSPGGSTDAPGATTSSAPITMPYSGGDVSVSVWAYTGTAGNVTALSQPASLTYAIPGAPKLTATAVSGVEGEAMLSWSAPTFDGDTLVLRTGPDSSSSPTGGTAVTINPGDTSKLITGLQDSQPNTGTWYTLFEQGLGADNWSSASSALAFPAPAPEGDMVEPSDDNDATTMHLSWVPPICTPVVESQPCNHAVLVENPGTKVAADPTDGKVETDPAGIPDGGGFNIKDVTAGNTYTFTVFNVATRNSGPVWSAPSSETVHDLAEPNSALTSTPVSTATVGQSVTLKATLATVGTSPTGNISFGTSHGVLCAHVPVTVSHTALCHTTAQAILLSTPASTTQPITIGSYYFGDSKDLASLGLVDLTVEKASPSMSLKVKGQKTPRATIKAVVAGAAGHATGTITMTSGHLTLCHAKALSAGTVSCKATVKKLGVGRHKVKVKYSGSRIYTTKTATTIVKLTK